MKSKREIIDGRILDLLADAQDTAAVILGRRDLDIVINALFVCDADERAAELHEGLCELRDEAFEKKENP